MCSELNLTEAIRCLDAAQSSQSESALHPARSSSKDANAQVETCTEIFRSAQPGQTEVCGSPATGTHTFLHNPEVHQLQVVLLSTLIQSCGWLTECKGKVWTEHEHDEWLIQMLNRISPLKNLEIQAVAMTLMSESSHSDPEGESGSRVIWERNAIAQFHGRLLPGCCYLGCINLSGVSESKLATQICSGCKQARYCSVVCQRRAWKDGGHSLVCDRQGCR